MTRVTGKVAMPKGVYRIKSLRYGYLLQKSPNNPTFAVYLRFCDWGRMAPPFWEADHLRKVPEGEAVMHWKLGSSQQKLR
ncbi:hypothetical protein TUM17379_18860 [Shewanella algae]|uniref:Uncharacterized protein n=1 Tax=Shewanella algae TaxID=38313 RepID=A0AAD1NM94_9GAMM|nr:hypothetical protein TUM17379_18860 [Shewanella algae]